METQEMIAIPAGAKITSAIFSRTGLTIIAALIVAAGVYLLVQDRKQWKSTATNRQAQLVAEKSAHATTVANYRAAADRARRLDAENIARVKAEQTAINERTSHEFEARIAAARAHAERLRRQPTGSAANPGSAGATPVPGVPAASGRAPRTAGEDGLSVTDRLIATEQAIQLDELIKWVKRQAGVDVGNEASPAR
jgi:hypothetical protein